jgi:hypothetical protein
VATIIGTNLGHGERPAPAILREAGCTAVRLVLEPHRNETAYLADCKAAGLRVLGVLARESFRDEDRSPHLRFYREAYHGLLWAVQVGNEPDLDSPSSWTMSQGGYGRLIEETRDAMPDAYLVGAGLAGGWPHWLGGLPLDLLDAAAVHPYGRCPDDSWGTFSEGGWGFGSVGPFISDYAAFGKPLIVSEYGCPDFQLGSRSNPAPHWHPRMAPPAARGRRNWGRYADYIGGMTAVLRDHPAVEAAFQFAWSDAVPGFGLHRADGSPKPAYERFRTEALMAQQQPEQQPDPAPAFHVGPGVREVAERHGLEIQGSEWYPDPPGQWSMTPTDRYMLVYVKAAGRVRLLPWSDA